MTILFFTSIIFFLILCFLLILVVLVQESKSLGLGASFGGDPGSSVFGTSTAQVLKKFTANLGLIFVASCILLSIWSIRIGNKTSNVSKKLEHQARK